MPRNRSARWMSALASRRRNRTGQSRDVQGWVWSCIPIHAKHIWNVGDRNCEQFCKIHNCSNRQYANTPMKSNIESSKLRWLCAPVKSNTMFSTQGEKKLATSHAVCLAHKLKAKFKNTLEKLRRKLRRKQTWDRLSCTLSHAVQREASETATIRGSRRQVEHTSCLVCWSHRAQSEVTKYWEMVPWIQRRQENTQALLKREKFYIRGCCACNDQWNFEPL